MKPCLSAQKCGSKGIFYLQSVGTDQEEIFYLQSVGTDQEERNYQVSKLFL